MASLASVVFPSTSAVCDGADCRDYRLVGSQWHRHNINTGHCRLGLVDRGFWNSLPNHLFVTLNHFQRLSFVFLVA